MNVHEETHAEDTATMPILLRDLRNYSASSRDAGALVALFGIAIPALTITVATGLSFDSVCGELLRHPLESIFQIAAVVGVPIINASVWHAIKTHNMRHGRRLGILIGFSNGVAFLASLVTSACLALSYPLEDPGDHTRHMVAFLLLCASSLSAFFSASFVGWRLRSRWETEGARRATVWHFLLGFILSFLSIGLSEGRAAFIKVEEAQALFSADKDAEQSLSTLRHLDCERDLRMDVANYKTEGLSGLFVRLTKDQKQGIYFLVTGRPYQGYELDNAALESMPDTKLGSKIVGEVLPDLSLSQSSIAGRISPKTLTSSVDWSFVFSNKGNQQREARAEIALPPDGVVAGMTYTMNGEEKHAVVAPASRANQAYHWVVVENRRDPAMVCDVGRGRVLMQCFPVQPHADVRINLTIKAPLTIDNQKDASLTLPRLLATNFTTSSHKLRMRSSSQIQLQVAGGCKTVALPSGENVLTARLEKSEMQGSGLSMRIKREDGEAPVAVLDRTLTKPGYILKWHKQVDVNAPKYIVAVIDSSSALRPYKENIIKALTRLTKKIPTSVVIASDASDAAQEPSSVSQSLELIRKTDFIGGKTNIRAVVAAAEEAGEREGGAVLWIHGPQPLESNEMQTMTPYLYQPSFFEMGVDDGWTDTATLFKNHRSIGPFNSLPHTINLADDLERLVTKWSDNGKEQIVKFVRWDAYNGALVTGASADDVTALWANGQIKRWLEKGNPIEAAQMAGIYQLVSPLSSAVVLERDSDYQRFNISPRRAECTTGGTMLAAAIPQGQPASSANGSVAVSFGPPSAEQPTANSASTASDESQFSGVQPVLQGATNGTLGPQGNDATYITGINTAGTVRVNNVAQLEATLNLLANSGELLAIALGLPLLLLTIVRPDTQFLFGSMSPRSRIITAVAIVLCGLALPGFVNYMVASARDANLFS
jgi:hypothetical protein